MQLNIPPRATDNKILALRSACAHIAQAKLLTLRVANEAGDPDLERELRDMAGILAHVISELEQLGRRTR
jgi:hypothetical protein